MTGLLLADPHITDDPRESYRLSLREEVARVVKKHKAETILILGDLTVEKDRHSAWLVNWWVDTIVTWSKQAPVIILKGNHDYTDPSLPYFKFLSNLHDRVRFITDPTTLPIMDVKKMLLLPHTWDYKSDWKKFDFTSYGYIFTHQTFTGAKASNGKVLEGVPHSVFDGVKGKIWSGDIHVPQQVGPVEYVGAPYRINFGDRFTPRMVFIGRGGSSKNISWPGPLKHLVVVDSVRRLGKLKEVRKNDLVKIRYRLSRSDYVKWSEIRADLLAESQNRGWVVRGIEVEPLDKDIEMKTLPKKLISVQDPRKILKTYAKKNKVDPKTINVGLRLLKKVK